MAKNLLSEVQSHYRYLLLFQRSCYIWHFPFTRKPALVPISNNREKFKEMQQASIEAVSSLSRERGTARLLAPELH